MYWVIWKRLTVLMIDMNGNNKRIALVDAFRGFALLGIVLIHFVEHFDFFYTSEYNFIFSPEMDQKVMDVIIFLVSGKAYSIFAITFGFSFFIQINRKEEIGIDYRGRYAWRLAILLIMGLIHSLIYRGDILHIYALMGFPLLLLYKLNNKVLVAIALLLIMEIPILYHLVLSFIDSSYIFTPDWGGNWFAEAEEVYARGSFWDVVKINFWKSRYLVYAWTYYTGRAVQLMALFIIGLLIGRKKYFENISKYRKQISLILLVSIVNITLLHFAYNLIANSQLLSELQIGLFSILIKAMSNLGYTTVIMSIFILINLAIRKSVFLEYLTTYGRMSLTNYIVQAVFGVIFFFGFGFGMWKYLGATWSLIMGICFFIIQVVISRYWLTKYLYGPIEWLWRATTNMDFSLEMRK